jgi:hypothetical protein
MSLAASTRKTQFSSTLGRIPQIKTIIVAIILPDPLILLPLGQQ